MDIDVEHEGQRTKVTTALQSERAEADLETEANHGGQAQSDGTTSEGTKVSSSEQTAETSDSLDVEPADIGRKGEVPVAASTLRQTGRLHSCVCAGTPGL